MMRSVVGVVGHVDHGKTSLVRALTGMETDRLAEEKARGISIALGFAHLRAGDAEIDLIDMPGHERFVRTMVAGAAGTDAILLVIDAGEGIKPQTREHLDIARLLGIGQAVIAISRADLATDEAIGRTATEAERLVAGAGLTAPRAIVTSIRSGRGLPALRAALERAAARAPSWEDHGAPSLPIDRAFSIAGQGTIVTGTLRGGRLATGDVLEIAPAGTPCRVRGLHVHNARVSTALPGQRVAVNLRGIDTHQAARGATLAPPGCLKSSEWLSVTLQSVADAPPLRTGSVLRLLIGTQEVDARLRLLDCDTVQPGQRALAQLRCTRPVSVSARQRFILRVASPARSLAGGAVLDPQAARARRHEAGALARLAALAGATPSGIILSELAGSGPAGASLAQLSRLAGIGTAMTVACLAEAGAHVVRGHAITRQARARLLVELPRLLARHKEGVAAGGLARVLPGVPETILQDAAEHLVGRGILARAGAHIRVPHPDQEAEQSRREAARKADMAEALRLAGLCPPDEASIAPDFGSRRALDQLIRAGIVIRAPDRVQKRDILFHRDAIEAARLVLAPLLAERALLVSEIGAALGISRKYSVPLLEYLDGVQFTTRAAERRRLALAR